jgi:serine protease Do
MKRASIFALVLAGAAGAVLLTQPFGQKLSFDAGEASAEASSKSFWREAEPAPAIEGPESFADLAEQLSRAVVSIRVDRLAEPAFGSGDLFEEFFGQPRDPEEPQRRRRRSVQAGGSGFVISRDGYIVTNNHVIEEAQKIVVVFDDGVELEAEIVGRDPKTDLALLKIAGDSYKVAPLGDSEQVRIGEWVMAIGNPLGLDHTVTVGILSAKGRRDFGNQRIAGPYDDFLQTDASINPGNSGGPLIDMRGNVIGINTAIARRGQGIGFAIPINMAKDLLPQLKSTGHVTRGWLGVQIQPVTKPLAKTFGLDEPRGALVGDVFDDSPASKANLKVGDVIVEFNGKDVKEFDDLPRIVASTPPGTEVKVRVLRDGKKKTLKAKLERMDDEEEIQEASLDSTTSEWGFEAETVTSEIANRLGLEDAAGMVVTGVEPGSPAAEAGLRSGDVILQINRKQVSGAKELHSALEQEKDHATLLIQRGASTMFLAIERD